MFVDFKVFFIFLLFFLYVCLIGVRFEIGHGFCKNR